MAQRNFIAIVVRAVEKRSHLCTKNVVRHVEPKLFY